MQEEDELKVNLKHLAHYTLLWIIYVDDECEMHRVPKVKNYKYLVRMYWMPSEAKYRNTDYMHGWHPTEKQQVGAIIMELGKFLTKEYLNGQE